MPLRYFLKTAYSSYSAIGIETWRYCMALNLQSLDCAIHTKDLRHLPRKIPRHRQIMNFVGMISRLESENEE